MVSGQRAWVALLAIGLLLAAIVAVAQDQRLVADVDRSPVRANESFSYTLRAEGAFSGRPDLSALGQDFDILDTFRSTSIQIVNGRTSQIAEWVVALMPRGPGTFELPAAELDGVRSNAVMVEVLPAVTADSEAQDIFMEVEVDRPRPYVQSQVIYTLRLFVGVGTGPASLTVPLVEGGEAIVEKLGSDREYRTVRDGRDFNVRERRYAIFPQEPGKLSIGPVVFEAFVQQSRALSRTVRLRSDVIELEVRPAVSPPPEFPNAVWLPASSLALDESWSRSGDEFAQGVPQTRTLTISAEGLLETQLPELSLAPSPDLRQYPDQPELNREVTQQGIVASRTERFAVIAQQAGALELPAVELPWWSVDEERWNVARLEPRVVTVLPDTGAGAEPDSPAETRTVERVEQDPGLWPWLAAGLGAGWFLTLLAWLFSSRSRLAPVAKPTRVRPIPSRQLLKQLVAACRVNDAQRTRELLLGWAERQFSEDPPRNLGALAGRLSGELATEIGRLEAALYGPRASEWRGQRLAELLQKTRSVARSDENDPEDPLVPLYR